MLTRAAQACPHCGGAIVHAEPSPPPAAASPRARAVPRYDLEELAALAQTEKAFDETVKSRVNQQDIRKLVELRRRRSP